jgi:hypothetical protein
MARQPNALASWHSLDLTLGTDCLRVASYSIDRCIGRDRRLDVAGRLANPCHRHRKERYLLHFSSTRRSTQWTARKTFINPEEQLPWQNHPEQKAY